MNIEKKRDENDREKPLSIAVTLSIDENNLVEVRAVLTELPEIELTKTLSRGNADEELFMDLETMIDEANQAGYDTYTTDEITTRSVDIITNIHKVIAKTTGEVIEPVYNLARMNIDKAQRLARENVSCYPLIYYAEDLLSQFPGILAQKQISQIVKKIDYLRDMNQNGTYDENVAAYNDLNTYLDKFPLLNLLTDITKAGELCEENDPAKAPVFFNAVSTIMDAADKDNVELLDKTLDTIMPRVKEVLDQFDHVTGNIEKGITR